MSIFNEELAANMAQFNTTDLMLFNSIGVTFCALGIQSSMQYITAQNLPVNLDPQSHFAAQINRLTRFMDSVGNTTFVFLMAIVFNFIELIDYGSGLDDLWKIVSILFTSFGIFKILISYFMHVLFARHLENLAIRFYINGD